MDSEHFRKLENMYRGAPCNGGYQPDIRVEEGVAEVSFEVKPEMHHAGGSMHGSHYFKILDDAAFFAAASLNGDQFMATAQFNIYLMRPVVSGVIRAEGKVLSPGKRMVLAEAVAYNEAGKVIGRGRGSFMPSGVTLVEDFGYRV